jgi:ubiquinone/menaquinone biosynthesis C-methylase UbiE
MEVSRMSSLDEREYAEKLRSAREASQTTAQLITHEETIARYRSPPETTIFPLEYAFHLLGDVKGKTILEFGCGDGLNTIALANRGAKIIALDLSAELLDITKKRVEANGCDGVDVVVGSAHALPLADESVDVVFGMAILHHLDLEIASREVRRVLKKGGRGIFEEPMRNSKLVARVREFLPKRSDISPFERPLTDEEIKNFSAPYGNRNKTFQLVLSSLATLLPAGSAHAVKLSARIDAWLLGVFPSLAHYGTVRVFEIVKN